MMNLDSVSGLIVPEVFLDSPPAFPGEPWLCPPKRSYQKDPGSLAFDL